MPYGQSGIGLLSFCLRKLQHKAKNPQYKNGQKTHALCPAVLVEQFFMDNKKISLTSSQMKASEILLMSLWVE